MTPGFDVDAELVRLRDWRHDVATPEIAALKARVDFLTNQLSELTPKVERMAKADEIADAVAQHMQKARRGLLTTGEKVGGAIVGLAAVASVVLQLLGR